MYYDRAKRQVTVDGLELQFGSNFLGPFAVTALLMPALLRPPPEMVPYSNIKDSPEPWNTERDKAVSLKMAPEVAYSGRMSDSLGTELVHVTCGNCKNITSFSMASLEQNSSPACPYCGQPIPVNFQAAERDARREAQELDQSVDALGSIE